MEELEKKYIDLLLTRCLNFNQSKSLFISYDKVNQKFVDQVIQKAKDMGIEDIGMDCSDIYELRDKLMNIKLEDIENDPYFNKELWNTYAEKNASFLMLETEFPHVLDAVSSEKIAKAKYVNRSTREIFRQKEVTYQIPWCIAALPNEVWARDIFGDHDEAYTELFHTIMEICMVNTDDPIKSWDNYLKKTDHLARKLNNLKIKSMHYKNSLGTDLYIEMPKDTIWTSAANDKTLQMLVNMPSYEIFSSPHYLKTSGVVYSSRPLVYGGGTIDHFYLRFDQGRVVDYSAEVGYDILKGIIESDSHACYLGEVALVNYDSPISNTGLVFGTTLIDENASCHLALGDGFSDCISNGTSMSKDQLLSLGVNQSKQHVDFMIGTPDLEIEAETEQGITKIFKNGNFNI